MKLMKTLPAAFAIALFAGCANEKTCDENTCSDGQKEASCCKGEKTEGSACCDGAKVEKVTPADKAAPQKN